MDGEATPCVNCPYKERIVRLETKVDKIESTLDKLMWGIFGTLSTSLFTLIVTLIVAVFDK